MKFRTDFVTNSSSSSYICEVCNHVESGWDLSLSDAEMYECEIGHIFCREEIVGEVEPVVIARRRMLEDRHHIKMNYYKNNNETEDQYFDRVMTDDDAAEEFAKKYYNLNYNIPKENCPICSLSHIPNSDKIRYMMKELNITKEQLVELTREFIIKEKKEKQF